MHFRILKNRLRVLKDDRDNLHMNFCNAISYHILILNLFQNINQTFAPILFTEVSLSIAQICYGIVQMFIVPNIRDLPFNVLDLGAVTMQLMIYCYGGEHCITEVRINA